MRQGDSVQDLSAPRGRYCGVLRRSVEGGARARVEGGEGPEGDVPRRHELADEASLWIRRCS